VMHGREKSDFAIVATKPANKAGQLAAEWVERRAETEGNMVEPRMRRTPSRESVPQGPDRVRPALPLLTQGGSRMPESGKFGSERGVFGNGHPYRTVRRRNRQGVKGVSP
jgi:hypothetical protein